MKFEDYFSFEAIVGDLIRWRVKGKGTIDENGRRDVEKVLPSRKAWSRAGAMARKGVDPEVVRKQAIWRTVMQHRRAGTLGETEWGRRLTALVEGVREAVFSGDVEFEKPRMIKIAKGYKDGVREFRDVASFDRLADRVILSRTTAYVRDVLEDVLGGCCYSFRRDPEMNHQLAIKNLQEWRERQAARPEFASSQALPTMYVAECDIRRFFDHISHYIVRICWDSMRFDPLARNILDAYLSVYSSTEGSAYVHSGRVALISEVYTNDGRRGLPQGGSFSTVLANLVLHSADKAVKGLGWDEDSFYARYCDDVVIAHPDESICRSMLESYMFTMEWLELPVHPVEPFIYFPEGGKATDYYIIKSKGPFRWGEPKIGEANCAPWVSFLGSQVRYDGETRIRKESIERHIRALGCETAAAVREIDKGNVGDVAVWFARFRNRLIAKGVGYVTAKVNDCHLCWAGAFMRVTPCADTRMQMRRLDRVREGMLCKVWRMVMEACGNKHRRYKGRPFSYYGFLKKAVRPTNLRAMRYEGQANMAYRRRIALSYSEL